MHYLGSSYVLFRERRPVKNSDTGRLNGKLIGRKFAGSFGVVSYGVQDHLTIQLLLKPLALCDIRGGFKKHMSM